MNVKIKRKVLWAVFGLLSILIKVAFDSNPQLAETFYSQGVFLGIRWLLDALVTWLPFPVLYLFIIGLLLWIGYRVVRFSKAKGKLSYKLLYAIGSITTFVLGGIGLFFWVWGYNYSRVKIEDHLGLTIAPLSLDTIEQELRSETLTLIDFRNRIEGLGDTMVFEESMLPDDYEQQVRIEVEDWLETNGYPTIGRVRGRELYPKGIFLYFSSSGLYFPFTGEGHVDAGVHALQKPYIIAHEMTHGYGFGEEGTCNFTGYLTCFQSKNPVIAYSGQLSYWRTLATNYLRYKPKEYSAFRDSLPLGIQKDLDAINARLLEYPDLMPRFRYYAYDAYLKAQGISEGIKSYNRVLVLTYAWKRKKGL